MKALVGPTLSDVLTIDNDARFSLASAYYSAGRLDAMELIARRIELMVRLNINSIDEWVSKAIAPDALLRFWTRHGVAKVKVFVSPTAHAKVYFGPTGFLIGSANCTIRGLCGTADEILWGEKSAKAIADMDAALREYQNGLERLEVQELERYVKRYGARVGDLQAKAASRSEEAFIPRHVRRPKHLGTYDEFLRWLEGKGEAADIVLDRARGAGNLQGHIRMNFFGIRQFLLASPSHMDWLAAKPAESYRVRGDDRVERAMRRFVKEEAANEGHLNVDTWRTYLPEFLHGKPKTGGGTIGNVNRMLPLVARWLKP